MFPFKSKKVLDAAESFSWKATLNFYDGQLKGFDPLRGQRGIPPRETSEYQFGRHRQDNPFFLKIHQKTLDPSMIWTLIFNNNEKIISFFQNIHPHALVIKNFLVFF